MNTTLEKLTALRGKLPSSYVSYKLSSWGDFYRACKADNFSYEVIFQNANNRINRISREFVNNDNSIKYDTIQEKEFIIRHLLTAEFILSQIQELYIFYEHDRNVSNDSHTGCHNL